MMEKINIVLASRNRGKVRELQQLLNQRLGDVICLLSLDDVGFTDEIEENGTTFAENALIKARALCERGFIGLGDDSGLTVAALDGAPGIYSARYAGNHDDAANNALLLKNLEGVADRSAAFVCTLACVFPDGSEPIVVEGRVEGVITHASRGENGFGYDPIFYYPPMEKTAAEMTPDEKNAISHRGAAVALFAKVLKEKLC